MSVTVMGLAWYVTDLTPAQKAVLVALADHADDDGSRVYPSVERIGVKTSYAERTVRRALADLREMGLIHVVREATHHAPTEYRLDLQAMKTRQESPATESGHDLPEMHPSQPSGVPESALGVPESANRPARNAPKPSYNHQREPSERSAPVIHATLPGADIDDYDDELYAMETILQQVVKENFSYPAHAQRIREGAKALLVAGHTPEEVAAHFGEGETYWYTASHGRKGDKPWVSNVVGEIASAVRWKSDANAPDPWALIERAWKEGNGRVVLEDGRVHAAVERMGGWLRFKEAAAREIPFLKRAFMEAYNASRSA